MKKFLLIGLSVLFFIVGCSQPEKSDRQKASDGTLTIDEHGYVVPANSTIVCRLEMKKGVQYNVRSGPGMNHYICDGLNSKGNRKTPVLQLPSADTMNANWVMVLSPHADKCPRKQGYVHVSALTKRDQQIYKNGTCGRSFVESAPRGKPESTPRYTRERVPNRNGYSYPFILPRCLGTRDVGGGGHFGASREGGRTHKGKDFYSPYGTPITSPCDGKVVTSKTAGKAGRMVIINCYDGNQFRFFHLHSRPPMARLGAKVSVDTIIGGTGTSGNACLRRGRGGQCVQRQAPQVHVEFWPGQRKAVDPSLIWDCDFKSGF